MYKIRYREKKIRPYISSSRHATYSKYSPPASSDDEEEEPKAFESGGMTLLQEETDFIPDEIFLHRR